MLFTLALSLVTQALTVAVPFLAGRMVRQAVEKRANQFGQEAYAVDE